MQEQPSPPRTLPPAKKLENLYDSLADDAINGSLEVDEETKQKASSVARIAKREGAKTRKASRRK